MSGQSFPLVGGRVMRVTRVDGCGTPVYGECSRAVSDGFVSVALTAVLDEGTAIDIKNANGRSCVKKDACPTLSGYTAVVTFCQVDPELFAMMTGQAVVYDAQTDMAVGFRVSTDVQACDQAFALEVWSNVPSQACVDGTEQYGYVLFPFFKGGVIGDFTIENNAVSFVISGAKTQDGTGWGEGPYNVVNDALGQASGLTPGLDANDHLHVQLTPIAPPEPTDGCVPLDDPDSPATTGATAGTPGTWEPAGANRPDDFDSLTGVTANPATAWTSGQYVVLEDGTTAYWNATAWVEGEAP